MSGIAEGGGRKIDEDTDREGEDRRRDVHSLSIEFVVTNGFSPALQARQKTHITHMKTQM